MVADEPSMADYVHLFEASLPIADHGSAPAGESTQ
jgi:hypothetical protein